MQKKNRLRLQVRMSMTPAGLFYALVSNYPKYDAFE